MSGNALPTISNDEEVALSSSLRQHATSVGQDESIDEGQGGGKVQRAKPNPWVSLFTTLHLMVHMMWLQVSLWYGRFYISFVGGSISNFNRKVVIIGDDSAIGVGDWVTLGSYPGIHRRLNDAINKDVMKRAIGRGIFWNAYDGGRSASTTSDWQPECAMTREVTQMKRKWRLMGTRNLFDSLFDPNVGEHRDAEIVVILLGQHDRCDPVDTKRHLVKMVMELLRRNKYVLVCTTPNYPYLIGTRNGAPTSPNHARLVAEHRARNAAIREAVEHVQTTVLADARDRKGMLELVDLVQRPLPYHMFRFSGKFLTGKGYDTVTTDILNALTPMMRRVDQDKAVLKVSPTYSHFR